MFVSLAYREAATSPCRVLPGSKTSLQDTMSLYPSELRPYTVLWSLMLCPTSFHPGGIAACWGGCTSRDRISRESCVRHREPWFTQGFTGGTCCKLATPASGGQAPNLDSSRSSYVSTNVSSPASERIGWGRTESEAREVRTEAHLPFATVILSEHV